MVPRLLLVALAAAALSSLAPHRRAARAERAAPAAGAEAAHRWPSGRDWRDHGMPAIRGVTVGPIESSLQAGRGYGTASSAVALDEVARLGANWISITPFGRVFRLDDTHVRMDFEAPWADNRAAVRAMVAQAHARGLRVLVIPHLWVETGGWRGEIDPGDAAGWAAFQDAYRDFVLAWAADAAAAGADAFSIGVECKSWSNRFAPWWSGFIADVRATFPGFLTYSANWDEVERVVFWEELDLIGVNAFYPLADHPGATYEDYVAGAERWARELGVVATARERPVLLVEVGYTTRRDAAVEPWLWPDGMSGVVIDEHEQSRALAATFEAFLDEPWVVGFFVWRVYARADDVSQEAAWGFSPRGKLAEPLLGEVFALPWAGDPPPLGPRPPPLDRWPFAPALRPPS